jgi:hypothetical protein
LIERTTVRLTAKAEAHRERARVMAAFAPDILAFDDSPDGERLRRFELASGRGLSRSLNDLDKRRRSPLSVVSGPLSVAGCKAEAVTEAFATNEPTNAPENATNEPTAAEENGTNEPTNACENVTNEPTEGPENATNEPTDARENATNESVGGPWSVVRCPLPAVGDMVASKDEQNVTNEPTDARENTTNEPTEACEIVTNEPIPSEADPEEAVESFEQGVARRKAMRAESLRILNEEARREAEQAMAARRARLRERKERNAKPGNQPNGRAARTAPTRKMENVAREKRELDEFVKTVSRAVRGI